MQASNVEASDVEPSPVERIQNRKLKRHVELGLIAAAAGRCEFRGCNDFLYRHPLTQDPGNFAENAHIVAFRKDGPRGRQGVRPQDINSIENLMLLCAPCHTGIDRNPGKYPREDLEQHKRQHEERIRRATEIGPAMRTTVLQLRARIGTSIVEISKSEVSAALMPRYPASDVPHIIDLTNLGDERGGSFYELAAELIRSRVRQLYATGAELEESKHLSVFGLAPIPLLTVLGNALSNKIQTDFFQCHRDREDRWRWYEGAPPIAFELRTLREGSDPNRVALMLSLSGKIDLSALPPAVDNRFFIYEITLKDCLPNPGFLRQREDLEAFRQVYRVFLASLRGRHPGLPELDVFPAVPAPIAIVCGYDLLPKIDPNLNVFDNVRSEGGFINRMKVSNHERA